MAGSRVGVRGGSDRNVRGRVPRIGVETVSPPSMSSGSAAVWGALASFGMNLHDKAHSRYDAEAKVEGELRGVRDALTGNIDPNADRTTTRGGAYIKAAVDASLMTADANGTLALLEAFMNNPNDPQYLLGVAKSYSAGASAELMKVDPRAAVALQARMTTAAMPFINSAINNKEALISAQKKEARDRAASIYKATVASAADGIFSDDPAEAAAAMKALGQAYQGSKQTFEVDQAETFLMGRLPTGKARSHVIAMDDQLKVRLASLISSAPPEIAAGLGVMSGYRSPEHQGVLFANAVKKYGSVAAARKWVAPPGRSNHNNGHAADLTYKGKSLAGAPANVKKWVHENAPAFGLKFPLGNEPWHIEMQETRGGQPFVQPLGGRDKTGTGIAFDQEFYDDALKAGYKAWFSRQGDKVSAYLALQEGTATLQTFDPNGDELDVNIRDRLSDTAYEALLSDLRSQMTFTNSLEEKAKKDAEDKATKTSDATRSGFISRILLHGQRITLEDGTAATLQKPTPGEILQAQIDRKLDAEDSEFLIKQLTTEAADRSNSAIVKEAQRMIFEGTDAKDFLLKNIDQISAVDMRTLTDLNRTYLEREEALTPNQQFFRQQLEKAMQPRGIMATIDQDFSERVANGVIEYTHRVQEGEPAEAVYEDIINRGRDAGLSALPRELRPRFSVPDPEKPDMINTNASYEALGKALLDGQISKAAFDRQLVLLMKWDKAQKQAAADAAAKKGVTK